jgi:hypothetical protein
MEVPSSPHTTKAIALAVKRTRSGSDMACHPPFHKNIRIRSHEEMVCVRVRTSTGGGLGGGIGYS